MKYARVVADTAVGVRTEAPEGFFTPEVVAEFVEVPDQVENGWLLKDGVWTAPPPAPDPVPAVAEPPKVSPVEFKLLLTAVERVAIKASTDPIVQDFFSIVEDPRLTHVDLGLQSTQDALAYLETLELIAAGRKAEILTGNVL